jgi:hypothetical protein
MIQINSSILTPGFTSNGRVHQLLIDELENMASEMGLQFKRETLSTFKPACVGLYGYAFLPGADTPHIPAWMIRIQAEVTQLNVDAMAMKPEDCVIDFRTRAVFSVTGDARHYEEKPNFDSYARKWPNQPIDPDWPKWLAEIDEAFKYELNHHQRNEQAESLKKDLEMCVRVESNPSDCTSMSVSITPERSHRGSTQPNLTLTISTENQALMAAIATLVREHHLQHAIASPYSENSLGR